MRILVQRVLEARVEVGGETVGRIDRGLLLFVGLGGEDADESTLAPMARKVANLRIMADPEGRMNLSLLDATREVLAVSQFTLYADCRKGRRPSFVGAAPPDRARLLFDRFVQLLGAEGLRVETGRFGADMAVHLVNDGPVTIWLDSRDALG